MGTTVELGGLSLIGGRKANVPGAEEEVHNHLKMKHFSLFGWALVRCERRPF